MSLQSLDPLAGRLRESMAQVTPDVWRAVRRAASAEIARRLLAELDGVPSPTGRLIGETCDWMVAPVRRKLERSA